ncbi:PadR family transcriptional regulator [Rudaeicoccus suwonensis]|uniref:PadR family transcriptional regulator n=1 Tax=Rudaeicoccus suwonensis TaxID=657409 RepID=A0A561E8K7_9MICO|nr:PadR family transcriptional regulator [Rudaeicoccus suwonensis]TWE11954.1 PadR family transcriptional regulator [Rudaeicoccus suwonensis]
MSIKFSLLALLDAGPMYGAQLRHEFEQRTGGTWPLNVGQVYTTLSRLERDGLVETTGDADDEGRIAYRLTDSGRAEVSRWWDVPVGRDQAQRNELAIKLALAVTLPGVDVQRIVQAQRTATMTHLRDLTRLKRSADDADLAWALVLESLVFADEAEVRWLDHVESKLAQVRPSHARSDAGRMAYSGTKPTSRETSRT